MKAFRYVDRVALDALQLIDLPDPVPGPRDLLVRMQAAALEYRDLAIARDGYGGLQAPFSPLSSGAGEVIARGEAVTRFAVGDRVMPTYVPDWIDGPMNAEVTRRRRGGPDDGVLSELLVVDERAAVRAPRHLDALSAATLPVAAVTAYQVLFTDGSVRPGDVVVVQGTGGVSLSVADLARAAGARPIVVTRGRAARIIERGIEAIDANAHPQWHEELLRRGTPADLVVDVVGGRDVMRAVAAARVGGTVALVGFVGGTVAELDLPAVIRRGVTLRAASAGSRATFEALVRAMEQSELRPVIDRVVPFREASKAFHLLAEERPFGKVVIDFAEAGR